MKPLPRTSLTLQVFPFTLWTLRGILTGPAPETRLVEGSGRTFVDLKSVGDKSCPNLTRISRSAEVVCLYHKGLKELCLKLCVDDLVGIIKVIRQGDTRTEKKKRTHLTGSHSLSTIRRVTITQRQLKAEIKIVRKERNKVTLH